MHSGIGSHLWTHFITMFDYVLLPFYLLVIYYFALNFCNKWYPRTNFQEHPWRKYFLWGFTLKVAGAIFIGLIYEYYYGGGDTSAFFYHANVINTSFKESPVKWLSLILKIPDMWDPAYYTYTSQLLWYEDKSAYMVSCITALVSMLTFNTYLPGTIIFAAISFTGVWAMFRTFAEQYPKLIKPIAVCVLFIPSTFVWGSGIFKDTICLAALGWMTFSTFRMLIKKQLKPSYIITAAVCFYLLLVIKIYIILVFLPALAIWILNTYSQKIKTSSLRLVLKLAVIGLIGVGFTYATTVFAQDLGRYSLENLAETSNTTRSYIYWASENTGGEEGSKYDLGDFDPTLSGMLGKFPAAVNVTLFRPYLWEAKKPIVFLNAIEAFLFLFFTLKVLFVLGLPKAWNAVVTNPNIQFFLIFTLIFAFAVGISSYNFGALSRYRIPCLPFYGLTLVLAYYRYRPAETNFFSLSFK
jgi:hypothetical protein